MELIMQVIINLVATSLTLGSLMFLAKR